MMIQLSSGYNALNLFSFLYLQADGQYIATEVVIPEQTGSSISCAMTESASIDLLSHASKQNLLQLGWIHVSVR